MSLSPRVLYLGLNPPAAGNITHFPVISIRPVDFSRDEKRKIRESFLRAEWVIFTSQSAISPLFSLLEGVSFEHKTLFAVGLKTYAALRKEGLSVDFVPQEETQEGLIGCLEALPLFGRPVFCGRSSLSRDVLPRFLRQRGALYFDPVLYETLIAFDESQKPSLAEFDEVVFTSPSTVDGFIKAFGKDPCLKKLILKAIGPVTQKRLDENFSQCRSG